MRPSLIFNISKVPTYQPIRRIILKKCMTFLLFHIYSFLFLRRLSCSAASLLLRLLHLLFTFIKARENENYRYDIKAGVLKLCSSEFLFIFCQNSLPHLYWVSQRRVAILLAQSNEAPIVGAKRTKRCALVRESLLRSSENKFWYGENRHVGIRDVLTLALSHIASLPSNALRRRNSGLLITNPAL